MAKLRMVKRRQFLGNLRTAFGDRSEATGLTQQGSLAVPQKHCVVDKGSIFFQMCYENLEFCTNRRFQPWNVLDTL